MKRRASVCRETRETTVNVVVDLDASDFKIDTGLPFFDHMLASMALNAGIGIEVKAQGDLDVDDHHLVEDCALTIGSALSQALGDRRGIMRTAYAYGVLDEALVRAVIDLSGRGFASIRLNFKRSVIGGVATENLTHFFQSFAAQLGGALHMKTLSAANDHHRAEAAFKALGRAIGAAVQQTDSQHIPSTKGSLTC